MRITPRRYEPCVKPAVVSMARWLRDCHRSPLRRGNPHPRSFGTFARCSACTRVTADTSVGGCGAENDVTQRHQNRAPRSREIATWKTSPISPSSTRNVSSTARPTKSRFNYAEGIEYVVVNGQIVIDKEKHTGARPGRALRIYLDFATSG